jgi:hypothetical protein
VIIADVAVVVAFAVKKCVAHAEDALVVRISAQVLYEIAQAKKGHLVICAVAVTHIGLVLHAVNQGRKDLETGWASVVHAHKMFVKLFRAAVVGVAADATVNAIRFPHK